MNYWFLCREEKHQTQAFFRELATHLGLWKGHRWLCTCKGLLKQILTQDLFNRLISAAHINAIKNCRHYQTKYAQWVMLGFGVPKSRLGVDFSLIRYEQT